MAQEFSFLPPLLAIQMEFQASVFSLPSPDFSGHLGSKPEDGKTPPPLLIFLSFCYCDFQINFLKYKGTNPVHESSTLMAHSPSEAPLTTTITLGLESPTMNLGVHDARAGPRQTVWLLEGRKPLTNIRHLPHQPTLLALCLQHLLPLPRHPF